MRRSEQAIRPSLLCFLSLIGFAIVIISSLGTDIQTISPGTPFGLLGVLPPGYWAGMGIMLLSLGLGFRHGSERLFFVQSALVFLALWGAPSLFEGFPSTWDSTMHYYSSLEIARGGTMPTDPEFSYAYNYPGFFVLAASYAVLSDPPALLFLQFYPLFAALLTVAAIYLFVRTYVPGADYRLAFLIAAFANVWLQFNFSPQSLGLAAGLLIFVCLEREGIAWRLAAIGLFTFIVLAHPTTLVFVLGAILLKEVVGRIYRMVVARHRPIRWDRPWPIGAFLLIWLGWLITGSASFSHDLFEFIMLRLSYIMYAGQTMVQQVTMRTSPENVLGPEYSQIRLLAVALFVGAALLAMLLYLFTRKRSPAPIPKNILALFIVPFIIVPLDTLFFNGQLYDRGLLYIMLIAPIIFVPLLIGRVHRYIRPVLTVVAVLIVVAVASTAFYQESLYVSSERSIAASDYLAQMGPETYVVGGYYPYDVWSDVPEGYTRIKYNTAYGSEARADSIDNLTIYFGRGAYMFDHTSELWYRQWGIYYMYSFYEGQAASHYRVYDNGDYHVIFSRGR
ncbi:MAG: hypothetical protein GX307_03700 [Euryarchaeota archaeon]|nr:hypothetical protein [Euryarchaeota archaeon]